MFVKTPNIGDTLATPRVTDEKACRSSSDNDRMIIHLLPLRAFRTGGKNFPRRERKGVKIKHHHHQVKVECYNVTHGEYDLQIIQHALQYSSARLCGALDLQEYGVWRAIIIIIFRQNNDV